MRDMCRDSLYPRLKLGESGICAAFWLKGQFAQVYQLYARGYD